MTDNKFMLLMWKSYRLRRYHWIITSIEFGLPLLIAYIIIKFIDSERSVPKLVMQNATFIVDSQRKYIMYSALIVHLVYAPSNAFTDQLMDNVRTALLLGDEHLKRLSNEEEVEYFLRSNTDSNWIGVIFYNSVSDSETLNKLNYGLRNARIWNTDILYPSLRKAGPIQSDNTVEYVNRGFAGVQIAVNEEFLRMKTNRTPWIANEFSVQPFPYPEYAKDISEESLPGELLSKENISVIIGFIVVVTVLVLSIVLINNVIEEKETGVKELMKLTGVDEWLIWTSWFLHAFIVSAISLTILAIILKYPFNGEGSETVRIMKFSILWLILILYCIANISYCFMFCAVFHRAAIASSVFMISFAIVVFGITYLRIKNVSFVTKFSCIFPIGAFMQGFLRIRYFELSATEFNWSSITSVENDTNGVSLLFVLFMLVLDSILYFSLTFYITAINPGRFGARKSPLFIFKPLFSYLQDDSRIYPNTNMNVDNMFIETPPSHLEATIEIKNLYKQYGSIYAVNGANLNIYKGEITALLGHNGAGKTTTMSILTGLTTPSAGSIYYKNMDLFKNMAIFRKNLGLCPQENRLLSYLSVMDHLLFFGMLKGIPQNTVVKEANQYLRLMEMQSKRWSLAKELSGGMKRKLCLSISLMGKPGTLILDEPTSGMDVQSRRKIWDLLLNLRGDRIIILTTHFMEEADALGDRIAIMHDGIIVCHGTPIFLKKAYGTGYELTVTKAYEDTGNLTRVIQTVLPNATKEHETRSHVVYKLPLMETDKFPELFRDLESFKSFLGITSISVACTTMEHVFLKVGGMSIYDSAQSPKSVTVADAARDSRYLKTSTGLSLTIQQIMALLKKKYLYTKRNFLSLFTRIVLPSLTLLLILRGFLGGTYSMQEPSLELSLKLYPNPIVMVYKNGTETEDEFYRVYCEYVREKGGYIINATESLNIVQGLLNFGRKNITIYNRNLIIATELSKNSIKLLHNSWDLHSLPIAITTYSNALLRNITKNNLLEIRTFNHPVSVMRWRCGSMEAPEDFYPVWFFAMAFYTVDTITYFTGFLNMERVDGFKHIQMMSNLSSHVYWIGTFIFDLIFFLVIIAARIILFKLFDDYFNFLAFDYSFEVLALLMIAFGISGLLFAYVISFLSSSNEESYPIHFILNLMSVLLVGVYYFYEVNFFSEANEDFESSDYIVLYYVAKYVILFTPPLNFSLLFIKFMFIWIFNSACEFCPPSIKTVCEDQKKQFSYWEYPSSENSNGLLLGLKFLFIDAILYAAILALINLRYANYWFNILKNRVFGFASTNHAEGDDDVQQEYDKVQMLKEDESKISRISLLVDGLRKNYINSLRPFTAVTDVNFVVKPGECFGLLGVNGAGKTTTFKMLTGEILPTKGDAAIAGIKLSTNKMQYLSMAGYCAQTNSFIEELTGREMLTLIATLRGITGKDIKVIVDKWISILGLKDHQDQSCGNYSGGNKRKLCTAMSLIGNPAVVFLDEPTSGVDPVSRRKLYDVMGQSKKSGQAVVLTSHSMEECESLCERLTIITAGVMKCIGTPQHLKKRYAQGFSALIKINDNPDVEEELYHLKNDMMNVFTPEYCILKDEHRGLLYYQIKDTSLPWSILFERLEGIKHRHHAIADDYVLTDTTLEEVFISFAELEEMVPNTR